MPTLAFASLEQRKIVTGVSPALVFWTQERITSAVGLLSAPFKVLVGGTADSSTVASFVDVDPLGAPLALNPQTRFTRATPFLGLAAMGDELFIANPPEQWGLPPGGVGYEVTLVDADGILVNRPFWTREVGISWELKRSGVTIGTGSDGATLRKDITTGYFLDSQFQSAFATPGEALTHLAYTQSMLTSLSEEIRIAGQQYLSAAPGNPINTSYSV